MKHMSRLAKSVWGPACWTYLHAAAAQCKQPSHFIDLLRSLLPTLPCDTCRKHMREYMERNPPERYISISEDASTYMYIMHNSVNERLRKPVLAESKFLEYYAADRKPSKRFPFRRI
jgi:hypothetical protein